MGTPVSGYASTSDTLLRFRTAYLRAIAKAWDDEKFLKNMCDGRNILEWNEFRSLLPGEKQLPWTAHLKVRHDSVNGPKWAPGPTAGWLGPNDHFEILLPQAPTDQSDYTQALTTYFQQLPTLLGHNLSLDGDMELDGSAPDFVEFGNVFLQAIALSWSKKTEQVGTHGETFRELLIKDGIATLSRFYGYNNPWNFNFTFKAAEIVSPEFEWNPKSKDWGEIHNTIILNFPNRPEIKGECSYMPEVIRPVALASYNASGAHYPFSCP